MLYQPHSPIRGEVDVRKIRRGGPHWRRGQVTELAQVGQLILSSSRTGQDCRKSPLDLRGNGEAAVEHVFHYRRIVREQTWPAIARLVADWQGADQPREFPGRGETVFSLVGQSFNR